VPHVHPYPTRYHGPIWSYPTFGQPYESNPYARGPSYMGFGSPDGLGAAGAPTMGPHLATCQTGFDAAAAWAVLLSYLNGSPDGFHPNGSVVQNFLSAIVAAGIPVIKRSAAGEAWVMSMGYDVNGMLVDRIAVSLSSYFLLKGGPLLTGNHMRQFMHSAVSQVQDLLCAKGKHVPPPPKVNLPSPGGGIPLHGLGSACGCKGIGASPDGLGEPLLCASSGNSMVDIALGAVVGVLVSRTNEDRVAWGLAGAAAGWLGGLVGIVAVGGTGLYLGRR